MKQHNFQNCNDVLVAIINNKKDFALLQNELWYRIPVKSAPENIKSNDAKIIAFYQTATFKDEKWQVKWYGHIKRKTEVIGHQLFPNDPKKIGKANKRYYKIELEGLEQLQKPIPCRLGRKIVFIQTTKTKFLSATEINYLFNESPLEDTFFNALNTERIPSERQYEIPIDGKSRYLDFAIFCNANNIAVECDGNIYHDSPDQVHNDKYRDNELKGEGWSVMRFTTKMINEDLKNSIFTLSKAINSQGGLKGVFQEEETRFIRITRQLGLFDL